MNENTNMFTVRTLGPYKHVEINGREIPFVTSQEVEYKAEDLFHVKLEFDVGMYNEVNHGEDITPRSTGNPRADRYLRAIVAGIRLLQDARWWQLPRVVREVRELLENVS